MGVVESGWCLGDLSRSASYLSLSLSGWCLGDLSTLKVKVCVISRSRSLSFSLVEDLTVVNWEDEGLVELGVQATLNLY